MPRARNEARAALVRALASEGMSPQAISEQEGIPLRTVQRDLEGTRPEGRPRLPDGEGSRWTRQRQRRRAAGGEQPGT